MTTFVCISKINRRIISTGFSDSLPAETPDFLYFNKEVNISQLSEKTYLNEELELSEHFESLDDYIYTSGTFILDLEKRRNALLRVIQNIFNKKIKEPIVVETMLLDCDDVSVRNLQLKLLHLSVSDAQPYVWRLYNNETVAFATKLEYVSFIELALSEIAQRTTYLYTVKWQHQSAISSIDNETEMLSYSPISLW